MEAIMHVYRRLSIAYGAKVANGILVKNVFECLVRYCSARCGMRTFNAIRAGMSGYAQKLEYSSKADSSPRRS